MRFDITTIFPKKKSFVSVKSSQHHTFQESALHSCVHSISNIIINHINLKNLTLNEKYFRNNYCFTIHL